MQYQQVKPDTWPPTFIVGCPRSGTTLLSAILNRHPQICVPSESHFYRYMYEQFQVGWDWIKKDWPHNAYHFLEPMTQYYWTDYTPGDLIDGLPHSPKTAGKLFIHLMEKYTNDNRKIFWIEKTPDHLRFLDKIITWHPNARFIYIYRDGRDVALSLCKTGWPWITNDFLDNMLLWFKYIKEEHNLNAAKCRYYIKYEDLISSPEQTIRQLCSFLGVGYFHDMLTPNGSELHLAERQSIHKQKIFQMIDHSNKDKWKREIDRSTARIATTLFKDVLSAHGYDTTPPPVDRKIIACHKSIFFDYYSENYSCFISSSILKELDKLGWTIDAFTWREFPDSVPDNAVVAIPDYQIDTNFAALAWFINNIALLKIKRACRIVLLRTGDYKINGLLSLLADMEILFRLAWRKNQPQGIETALDLVRVLQ